MLYLSGFFIIVAILALFLFAYVAHKKLVSSMLFLAVIYLMIANRGCILPIIAVGAVLYCLVRKKYISMAICLLGMFTLILPQTYGMGVFVSIALLLVVGVGYLFHLITQDWAYTALMYRVAHHLMRAEYRKTERILKYHLNRKATVKRMKNGRHLSELLEKVKAHDVQGVLEVSGIRVLGKEFFERVEKESGTFNAADGFG